MLSLLLFVLILLRTRQFVLHHLPLLVRLLVNCASACFGLHESALITHHGGIQ